MCNVKPSARSGGLHPVLSRLEHQSWSFMYLGGI